MRVGFIGLGVMGLPMAGHLLAAGHELALWARRPAAAAPLLEAGAVLCATPAALAAQVDVVISIVTASADVAELALGRDGLLEGFKPGAIHIDMSTIAPATARAVAARYAGHGVAWLDAPVSGGEAGAREARLAIMVGGAAAALERVRPLLACFGPRVVHIGPAGAGQVAKACNQMIMVNAIEACAEAMHLAAAHGVDPARVGAALAGGSAASTVLEVMGGRMARRDFSAGIQARLHHKDFAILLEEARALGAALPLAAQTWQQLNALMALGGARDDTSSLLKVLEASSGGRVP